MPRRSSDGFIGNPENHVSGASVPAVSVIKVGANDQIAEAVTIDVARTTDRHASSINSRFSRHLEPADAHGHRA